jgi:hypothetical protein
MIGMLAADANDARASAPLVCGLLRLAELSVFEIDLFSVYVKLGDADTADAALMHHKPAHDKRAHDQGADGEDSRGGSADGGHADHDPQTLTSD